MPRRTSPEEQAIKYLMNASGVELKQMISLARVLLLQKEGGRGGTGQATSTPTRKPKPLAPMTSKQSTGKATNFPFTATTEGGTE